MANSWATPTILAKEVLAQVFNNSVMLPLVHTAYKHEFVKVGQSINIKKPIKLYASEIADGTTIATAIQDVKQNTATITINRPAQVAIKWSMIDKTMTIQDWRKEIGEPAGIQLSNIIDVAILQLALKTPGFVGTPGATPTTWTHFASAGTWLTEHCVPYKDRSMVLNPIAALSAAGMLVNQNVFDNPTLKGALKEATIGRLARFNTYEDQNVVKYTLGDIAGAPLLKTTSTADAAQTTVALKGFTGTLPIGTKFTIADVYDVNPVSRETLSYLKQFTVTTAATATDVAGTGVTAVAISPSIFYTADATLLGNKNVSAVPTADAVITLQPSHACNIAFHKNAYACVTIPGELPESASWKARVTANGVSITLVRDYNILTNEEVARWDILFGVKVINDDFACVLFG